MKGAKSRDFDRNAMDQTLYCIMIAQDNPGENKKISECLQSGIQCEIIIDRHRLCFDPQKQIVTITRASDDVPFACKIGGCRMPYNTLRRFLDKDYSSYEGFEWI